MSYSEILCERSLRLIFEDNVEIIRNYRPDWLKNPISGKNLELDFYIPHIPLAIEIQGQHHYDDVYQIKKDEIKKQIVLKCGIVFIELSIFQIDPCHLRKKILNHSHFSQYQAKIKSYDKNWNKLTDIKDYKQKIISLYKNSKCILNPSINKSKDNRKFLMDMLDKNIMLNTEFNYKIKSSIIRITPLEIISPFSVKCRILGSDKIIFVKKKKLIKC